MERALNLFSGYRVSAGDEGKVLEIVMTVAHFVSVLHTNNPEIPPSSRHEGLRLLHGLATNLATSLPTPQEA